jgi:hypothetical protein
MMPVLSRGDAVRDTPGSMPNHNWTTEPEFMKTKSGNRINEGNQTAQPQPEPLEEDGKQGSMGVWEGGNSQAKPWGAKGGAK